MSGSLTFRAYTADDGTTYTVRIDKSNANGTVTPGGSGALMPVRTADAPVRPVGLRMRYVLARNLANTERRKFYVGTAANYAALNKTGATISAEDYPGAGDTAGATTVWTVTSARGERRNLVPSYTALDTGLTDGTAGQ